MPLNHKVAREQWIRYVYSRDMGHKAYLAKAQRCEDFFSGAQWDESVRRELAAAKRPALTINKVLITLSSIFGEQIDTRSEISFRPRNSAPPQNAELLTKTFRFISDANQLNWIRSDVFCDGCITSRGYYDVRLGFENNTAGEVLVGKLNPRAVLPDPDASDADPKTWNDVIVTSWVTPDDVELIYRDKEAADALRIRGESAWSLGYDSLDLNTDRFAGDTSAYLDVTEEMRATMRTVRLIDRQHRVLTKMKYFVDPKSGDKMPVPDEWLKEPGMPKVKHAVAAGGLIVSDDLCKRVRWTVTAEDFVLHDAWSPYRRLSVIPYFPYFRYGRTIGLVEGLIDPQELLNKSLSQELHVVNTMANSGWKVRHGAIQNMTTEELEQMGAKSGLVLEVNGDPEKDVVKITPNQIPQGLERLSFKAETYIKSVSGRGDNQLGLTRPDQSGKLAEEANKSSDVTLRKALDNLERTDYLLAHAVLDLVQQFYTDHRIMTITRDALTGETESVDINLPDPSTGEVLNDLSLGTYDVIITSQTARRSLEESEFANALGLREIGIAIPDRFMIENSNLRKKGEIIKAMDAEAQSPEGQLKRQAVGLGLQLEVAEKKANVSSMEADAAHKRAKAAKELVETQVAAQGEPGEEEKAQQEMALDQQKHEQEMQMAREKHQFEMQRDRELAQQKLQLQKEEAREKRMAMRITAVAQAKAAAQKPAAQPGQPAQPGGS